MALLYISYTLSHTFCFRTESVEKVSPVDKRYEHLPPVNPSPAPYSQPTPAAPPTSLPKLSNIEGKNESSVFSCGTFGFVDFQKISERLCWWKKNMYFFTHTQLNLSANNVQQSLNKHHRRCRSFFLTVMNISATVSFSLHLKLHFKHFWNTVPDSMPDFIANILFILNTRK